MIGRIAVADVHPVVDGGAYSARATAGELMEVRATVFREGHDLVGATAVLRGPDRYTAKAHLELVSPGIDLFVGSRPGRPARRVHAAGRGLGRPGRDLAPRHRGEGRRRRRRRPGARGGRAAARAGRGRRPGQAAARPSPTPPPGSATRPLDVHERLALAEHPAMVDLLDDHPAPRPGDRESKRTPVWVDRERATFSAWYELFPRSEGGLAGAAKRLPAIAAMGFDVVYLPPVHPIGTAFRKGPNNTLDAGPTTSARRGRSARATAATTRSSRASAPSPTSRPSSPQTQDLGMEVALDLALQCSPDHPWVTEHPDWFAHRADGSIAYAENPPKKYQDIYPLVLRRRPRGHPRRGAADRAAVDRPRRQDLPRRQPAHQAAGVLGGADRRGQGHATPTCCSSPRRSPGRR